MRPTFLAIGLAALPALLTAQVGGDSRAVLATHNGHAHLPRPGPEEAAVHLVAEKIIGLDDDTAALCRAAKIALAVGVVTDSAGAEGRVAWFRRAETYARRAQALDPTNPDALFLEAAALGLRADYLPVPERIDAADRVLAMARAILEIDPSHPGGLHLLGRLNAAAMRLNPMLRFLVKRLLGADALRDASWEQAEARLRAAVEAEPGNPFFRLELAATLRDTGQHDHARRHLRRILALPGDDPLTYHFQERARGLLAELD